MTSPRLGNIGEPLREIEVEPLEVPLVEPAPEPVSVPG